MIELIVSILTSSCLFFIFRLFPKFGIDTAQAIVVNYFTAFTCGCIVSRSLPDFKAIDDTKIWIWMVLSGFLFISLFLAMGISSVKNGVGVTSVVVKMSMALTMLLFVGIYHEQLTVFKIAGFVLAIAGVLLMSAQQPANDEKRNAVLLLPVLFFGSSLLDLVLKRSQDDLGSFPDSAFTASGFLAAGIFGLVYISILFITGKKRFHPRNLLGGVILGIPNYFSIFLLIRSYRTTGWSASTTLAVTAISIVSLSAIFGMIIFKESATLRKFGGLLASVASIVLLALLGE